jgi:DNA-binding PadR family transcriptional regulator
MTWRDAETEAMRLPRRPADHQILQLLTHLPLAPERVLENLVGLHGGASLYRRLDRLANAGLVAAIRPPVQPGYAARLWYLTDLGLATVALDRRIQVEHLARRNRLRSANLLALLLELPYLLSAYDLLAAIATTWIGPPRLLAWERPWRRRYQRPTAKAPCFRRV